MPRFDWAITHENIKHTEAPLCRVSVGFSHSLTSFFFFQFKLLGWFQPSLDSSPKVGTVTYVVKPTAATVSWCTVQWKELCCPCSSPQVPHQGLASITHPALSAASALLIPSGATYGAVWNLSYVRSRILKISWNQDKEDMDNPAPRDGAQNSPPWGEWTFLINPKEAS